MIPLVFPAEPPCSDKPYVAVTLPDGGTFGWPGLSAATRKDTFERVNAVDGRLSCPDTAGPSTCEYVVPLKGAPPPQVFATGDGGIFVRYECSPTLDEPRASWLFDLNDSPSVSYALPALPPLPSPTSSDALGSARFQLAKARAVLAACDATRCTDEVTTRRNALDAVLARDWSVSARDGEVTRIATGLDWATVAYTCERGEHSCTAELFFYDSSIVLYGFDEGDVAHRAWWESGSVSVTEEPAVLLQLDGDAVRIREP